jgi:hypothetical protein
VVEPILQSSGIETPSRKSTFKNIKKADQYVIGLLKINAMKAAG